MCFKILNFFRRSCQSFSRAIYFNVGLAGYIAIDNETSFSLFWKHSTALCNLYYKRPIVTLHTLGFRPIFEWVSTNMMQVDFLHF
jgi:hypothetical protein